MSSSGQVLKALDEKANAFDAKASEVLAMKGGFYSYVTKPDHFYIDAFDSGATGSGFGTAAIRKCMQDSFETKREGSIRLSPSGSSHLFYLYMGMTPIDRQINYFDTRYGQQKRAALFYISLYQPTASKRKSFFKELREILSIEKQKPLASVTDEEVIAHKDFFAELGKKTVSYVKEVFIPRLIAILQKQIDQKYPNTEVLTSGAMEMSPDGKVRWKKAIDAGKPMTLFKQLDHLAKYFTAEQQKVVAAYVARHSKVLPGFGSQSVATAMLPLDRGAKLRSGPDRMPWKCLQPEPPVRIDVISPRNK